MCGQPLPEWPGAGNLCRSCQGFFSGLDQINIGPCRVARREPDYRMSLFLVGSSAVKRGSGPNSSNKNASNSHCFRPMR